MAATNIISIGVFLILQLQTATSEPADCPYLRTIIPQCHCEAAVSSPSDIVINCRGLGLTSMPLINGTYGGMIYEFTLAKNDIEELPFDAFGELRIQRIDVTENKLTNISDFAFRNMENYLTVLKISGDPGSLVDAPFNALASLYSLRELVIQNFLVPGNDLNDQSAFQPFSNLQKLTLDRMSLTSISNNVFTGLTSLKELTISNHPSLVSYPVGAVNKLKTTLEKVIVTQTGITDLHFYAFNEMQALTQLVFSYNHISQLEDGCFAGLENQLIHLDLSFNSIDSTQLNRVGVLQALQTLHLQNIGLVTLTESKFLQNKTNLLELNLARNHLEIIPANVFQGLSKLTKLELSYNQINTLADDAFRGLSSLESLNLDNQVLNNQYILLPPMSELTSLKLLFLENTLVSSSPRSWTNIGQLQSLTQLKMRNTRLTVVSPMSFAKMENLVELDLSDNHIVDINQETFVGPRRSLKILYLTNNDISTFEECTFYNYSSDLVIDLYGNRLRCDCSLYWLSKAVKDGSIKFDNNIVTCFYPATKNGTAFTSFDPSSFCQDPPSPSSCDNYYYTSSTAAPTTTTSSRPPVNINVVPASKTINSIGITWTLDRTDDVDHVKVVHNQLPDGQMIDSREIPTSTTSYSITQLKSNTMYQICVNAYRTDGITNDRCIVVRTEPSATDLTTTLGPNTGEQMSNSQEVGIIIGAVIGGLLLFAILVAIIYLMVIRKRSEKDKIPVQPRNFTRSELPTAAYDSKRYIKKKKDTTDGDKNDVNVTVISDGKTGPNLGRVSAGSYQYLQDNNKPPYVNDSAAKPSSSPYENDVNSRPLPTMPRDSAGYYNPSFRNSTADTKPHEYSEIKL